MLASFLKRDLRNLFRKDASPNFQAQNGLLSLRSRWRSVRSLKIETPHGSPPDYHATRRDACLAWGCALPCLPGFERSAPRAIGGSQSLQTSSSVRTTNRTSVFRRRHLYRTFSKKRNIRLVRST